MRIYSGATATTKKNKIMYGQLILATYGTHIF